MFVIPGREFYLEASRTYKSIRNVKWGVILQLVGILTKFITRTVFVKTLGMDFNGLNGLFTEVISMMSLAEMGVGTAVTYNLYKPLAEKDNEALKRLMGLFKKAYRIIGFVMLGLGLLLSPFIHLIVRDVPFERDYIRLIFLLFTAQTAFSYFFAYKRSLLNADQNNYIVSIFSAAFNVLLMALSVGILLLTGNYVAYLIIQIAVTVVSNAVISLYADRRYPFLRKTSMVNKQERKSVLANIKHIFIGTLSGKITTSTDNILISVLISTHLTGIYSNYSLIMNSVSNLFCRMTESLSGGFGNLLATEDGAHAEHVFRRISFLFSAAGMLVSVVLYSVMTPFVKLWIGENGVIGRGTLFVCAVNVFFFIAREPLWKFVEVSGLFARDKNISIAGSAINLVVSVALGMSWGMTGIFIGTTCTLVIQIVLKVRLLYGKRLSMNWLPCAVRWLKVSLLTCGSMLLSGLVCSKTGLSAPLTDIAVKLLIGAAVPLVIICIFYGKTEEFSYAVNMIKKARKVR